MKIALFSDSFLPGVGGTENVVYRLALDYTRVGHDVLVVAPSYRKPISEKFPTPFKILRIKSIGIKDDRRAIPDRRTERALDSFAPDIIHVKTFGVVSNFGLKYAKRRSVPVFSTVHIKYYQCYKTVFKFEFLVRSMLSHYADKISKADVITTVSESMREELRFYGLKRDDVKVIRNGCNFTPRNDIQKQKNGFCMLYVGLVIKFKNIEFILKSLRELKKERADFTFYIVGDGPDKKYFMRKAKKFGLADNVIFTGKIVDRAKLDEIYAKSDLFLFASRGDSDGLTVLEAGAMKTPSLVLKDTGTSERITDGVTGFVSDNDIFSYRDKISYLMQNRELVDCVGERAHEIFDSWENVSQKYLDLYQSLIKKA